MRVVVPVRRTGSTLGALLRCASLVRRKARPVQAIGRQAQAPSDERAVPRRGGAYRPVGVDDEQPALEQPVQVDPQEESRPDVVLASPVATCAASSASATSQPVTAQRPPYASSTARRKRRWSGRASRAAVSAGAATSVSRSDACARSHRATASASADGPS